MNAGWILPLMLLALQSPLPGEDSAVLMRKGRDALATGLWEMASLHFAECLAGKNLPAAERPEVAIRLAEAWIREERTAEALELLSQSFVSKHPEAAFWKGQALAAQGRLSDALSIFLPLLEAEETPHRAETAFTAANLELALGQPDTALATLSSIVRNSAPPTSQRARLYQVEILLDLGRTAEARETMPATSGLPPADQALATFLDGRLLLSEGQAESAASRFQTLLDQPSGQSLRLYHLAAVGLADALTARNTPEAAVAFMLTFLQDRPDSLQIGALFDRLLDLLPETPSLSDPILERFSQWITPGEIPVTGAIASWDTDAAGAWPVATIPNELLTHALYGRVIGLLKSGTPVGKDEARSLLTRLRVEFPSHPLTSRALLQLARELLASGDGDRAFGLLDALRETAATSTLRGKAAFLEAQTAFSRGDAKQAAKLFDEAAESLQGSDARSALLNSTVIRMAENPGSMTIQQVKRPQDASIAADVELERALATPDAAKKRVAIEEFLTKHPDHPRVPEARLAAAESALVGSSPDLSFARAQLDTISAETGLSPLPPSRIALIKLRIEDRSNNPAATIATARTVLEQFPADPAAAEAMLILGRNLFETRSYNDARLILEKLAATDTDPGRAQAAWLLAARSAALVPTSQSQQEALILFDKAIDAKGPVSPLARLEKARLMIDMNRLPDAVAFLRKWFDALSEKDSLHLPAGLLLGEAIYAGGSARPESLNEALAVYDKLLVHAKDHPALFNRIQYLRGRTLEQIPDDKDPSGRRERQAFIAYYSVLETTTPPAEWHYFELCGFRALALLEKAGRWSTAIACAKKIATFKGPRAEEAATRASQLQLKHHIWED